MKSAPTNSMKKSFKLQNRDDPVTVYVIHPKRSLILHNLLQGQCHRYQGTGPFEDCLKLAGSVLVGGRGTGPGAGGAVVGSDKVVSNRGSLPRGILLRKR